MGGSINDMNEGIQIAGEFLMEKPLKMDDLGVSLF